MFLRVVVVITAIILAFLFPAYLIDAIRLADEEKPGMPGERPAPALVFW